MKFELFYPVKPFHINQHFGDNFPCVKDFGTPNQVIIDGSAAACPIGFDKLYEHWGMEGHNGTDLQAGVQNVYAAQDGTVIEMQTVPARGLGLGIITDAPVELECGYHFAKLRYWHLKEFKVNIGDKVKAGDWIGVSDNTGYSSGNHLHFELQPMDKDKGGHLYLVSPQGNIADAVSVEPYFNGNFAQDIPIQNALIVALTRLVELYKQILGKP